MYSVLQSREALNYVGNISMQFVAYASQRLLVTSLCW